MNAIALLIALVAQAAAPVTLTLRITDGQRQFRPGEIIPIELEFQSATPKRFTVDGATYDRSGRLTIDEFTIDRIDDVSDPMLDYFASTGGGIGGGIRGIGVLGDKPFTVKLELNDWFRFDKPGVYTLTVKSARVRDESVSGNPAVPVESNAVSFEILPRDAAWEASQLDAARRRLDANPPGQHGCRALQFLGTDDAVVEMIRRYGAGNPACEFNYMAGLFSAPNRDAVVRAMEEGLRAPDQPVTASYLRTLATLSAYLQHPEWRAAQTAAAKGRFPQRGELSRRPELIEAAISTYADAVTAALPDKTARARAITLAELQSIASRKQPASNAAEPRDHIAARFLDLPAERQAMLLEYQWQTVAGPAMLPALRRLVDAPSTNATPSIADLALRRLAQLAPGEARPLILREIREPRAGATLKTLGSLPEAELPELDEVLIANFEKSQSEIRAALVQRYATRAIAPRVLAVAGDMIGRIACAQQGSVLGYFLRVDEALGATLLDRAMRSRETGCFQVLHQVPGMRLTPAMETRVVANLDDADPEVVIAAIHMLGQHGSPAALAPLRAAFQRWHTTWSGRAAELAYSPAVQRPHARQAMVEDAFRTAIVTGRGWLLRAADVRELQTLCVTDNCRTQTGYMVHDDDTSIMIWSISEPDASSIELAQYRFTSIAVFKEMLARYPRGTAFTLKRGPNLSDEAAIAGLITFAASQGLSIKQ